MNPIFNAINPILTFLDTAKGAFWSDAADVTEGRSINSMITVTNAHGETMLASLHDLAQVSGLLQASPEPVSNGLHPVTVLNHVWKTISGVDLVAEDQIGSVTGFDVLLMEDDIGVELRYQTGGRIRLETQSNLAVRIFILKSFSEISAELANTVGNWVGQARIEADLVTGQLTISGIPAPKAPEVVAEEAEIIEEGRGLTAPVNQLDEVPFVDAAAAQDPQVAADV